MKKENFVVFFGSYSCFSNWYDTNFEVDGIKYNCSEQYYMRRKAIYFGDVTTARLILESSSPREHKRLGRSVNNFSPHEWKIVCRGIMREAIYHKFTQNERIKRELLMAKGAFVEANPWDAYWGVGLPACDRRVLQRKNWNGRNELGRLLDELKRNLSANTIDKYLIKKTANRAPNEVERERRVCYNPASI